MGHKIFGHDKEDTSKTRDVETTDFDDFYGLMNVNVDYPTMSIWNGDEVVVGGINDTIGTEWEDISTFDADNNYPTQTGVVTIYVSSTAVGDKYPWTAIATSGGARTVRLHYLNADWDATTADANMSGQKVVTVATDVHRVNKIEIVDVGASGEAAGDIFAGITGTPYLKIDVSTNESYCGYYYVPDGKNLVITDASCYPRVDNGQSLEFAYKIQEPKVVGATTNYLEVYKWAGSYMNSGAYSMAPNMNSPILVKDRCRIRIRARADAASGKAIGYFKGYLVDEKA